MCIYIARSYARNSLALLHTMKPARDQPNLISNNNGEIVQYAYSHVFWIG